MAGHPRLIWYHVPNGEERSERVGAKLRRMGLVRGVADVALVLPGGQAAFLEVKARGGRQSPDQVAFERRCIETGAPYTVVRSCAEAMDRFGELGRAQRQREAAMTAPADLTNLSPQPGAASANPPQKARCFRALPAGCRPAAHSRTQRAALAAAMAIDSPC